MDGGDIMRKDNKGMSLVELIIVIAIIAILGGLITVGMNVFSQKPADECARRIQQTLENARINCMGKHDAYVNLYKDADNRIIIEEYLNGSSKGAIPVGTARCSVTYTLGNGSTGDLGGAGSPLKIEFDRTNGGLKDGINGVVEIKVTAGSRTRTVSIGYLTGKIDYQ